MFFSGVRAFVFIKKTYIHVEISSIESEKGVITVTLKDDTLKTRRVLSL